MALFKKDKNQISSYFIQSSHDDFDKNNIFDLLNVPSAKIGLYDSLAKNIPILDAAVSKIARLCMGFDIECKDKNAQKMLKEFKENMVVGAGMVGMDNFIFSYIYNMLLYGTAVGEIILDADKTKVLGALNHSLDKVLVKKGKSTLDYFYCNNNSVLSSPFKYQNLFFHSSFNAKPGSVYGQSLLDGLDFVGDILLKIFKSIGQNFQRAGDIRYCVSLNDKGGDISAEKKAKNMAQMWSKTMSKSSDGRVSDFIAVGDVKVSAIGADNQILDSEVPVRQLLEQIISKTGLPPFLLGLNWSTTDRMSTVYADILTTELWCIRRMIEPVIVKILKMALSFNGIFEKVNIVWDDISLLDEVEAAKAKYYLAKAGEKIE